MDYHMIPDQLAPSAKHHALNQISSQPPQPKQRTPEICIADRQVMLTIDGS